MDPLAAYEPFIALGVACAAGLLIGFEREQSAPERLKEGEQGLGGVRTHPLVALMGGVASLLSRELGVVVIIAAFAAMLSLLVISYMADVRKNNHGLTSEAAFALSFLLGTLAGTQGIIEPVSRRVLLVLSTTVVITLLLSIKPSLHAFVQKVSREDIFATLKFLVVTVLVLPLLPDHAYGPFEALNPRSIGLMVVLISGVSFVGYVAIRARGARRGLAITGLVGGLVSSTAVTLSFSGRAREQPDLASSAALAIVLAGSIMFARVLVLISFINPPLVFAGILPLGAMTLAGLVVSGWHYRQTHGEKGDGSAVSFSNPFELSSAIKFAGLYAIVLLAAKGARTYFGESALYVAGLLAGTTDVDAITLSMSKMSAEGLAEQVAVTTILIATAANTCVKAGMSIFVGGWHFGRRIAASFAFILAAGGIGLLFLWLS